MYFEHQEDVQILKNLGMTVGILTGVMLGLIVASMLIG